jgi:hypothetical protein
MQVWWNQGVHVKSLSTYCFLVRCSIPACFLGLALVSSWQVKTYDMLRSIPTVSTEGMNAYNNTINAKLTVYGNLLNEAPIVLEQFGLDHGIVFKIIYLYGPLWSPCPPKMMSTLRCSSFLFFLCQK